jgi:hypothetical protein
MKRHKTATVQIIISYGYDIHSIRVSRRTFSRIERGSQVEIKGQGFPTDEGWSQDYWIFNKGETRELEVYCDDGREVYRGSYATALVDINMND